MKLSQGFSLIELVVFIVVTSLLVSTILFPFVTALQKMPSIQSQFIANYTAQQCMEWYVGQRRMNGFAGFSCPSTPSPNLCTAPAGFNIATNITCTTLNGDNNYMTIAVTVTGSGDATLHYLIAGY